MFTHCGTKVVHVYMSHSILGMLVSCSTAGVLLVSSHVYFNIHVYCSQWVNIIMLLILMSLFMSFVCALLALQD